MLLTGVDVVAEPAWVKAVMRPTGFARLLCFLRQSREIWRFWSMKITIVSVFIA